MLRAALAIFVLVAATAAGGGAAQDTAALLSRFEELEEANVQLRAQLEEQRRMLASVSDMLAEEQRRRLNASDDTYLPALLAAYVTKDEFAVQVEIESGLAKTCDYMWYLVCGFLVFFMQAGFAMLEAGACQNRNVQHILMKNLSDVCVGTIRWWILGWMLAYGFDEDSPTKFAGDTQFLGSGILESTGEKQVVVGTPEVWFFQWAFCATAATIVSGGVAERINFAAYVLYTAFMCGVIYPVVVGWTWSGYGWLNAGEINDVGYFDFAGSCIVHMTGGIGALVGAAVVGPRRGRFDPNVDQTKFNPHNIPLVILGTLILWFGWYGFNCGSTLGINAELGALASVIAMNTTLAASSGGAIALVGRFLVFRHWDIAGMCNGILAGLVSITAGCANVESGSAILIGSLGSLVCVGASILLQKLKVDDPLDAFAVHGACGCWGTLAAVLFDWGKGFDYYHGWSGFDCFRDDSGGCFENAWIQGLTANVIMILANIAWTGGVSFTVFYSLRRFNWLRATEETEAQGMDPAHHSPKRGYDLSGGMIHNRPSEFPGGRAPSEFRGPRAPSEFPSA